MKLFILNSVAIFILGLAFLLHIYWESGEFSEIQKMSKQIKCLEQDRIYVGFNFCADKEQLK